MGRSLQQEKQGTGWPRCAALQPRMELLEDAPGPAQLWMLIHAAVLAEPAATQPCTPRTWQQFLTGQSCHPWVIPRQIHPRGEQQDPHILVLAPPSVGHWVCQVWALCSASLGSSWFWGQGVVNPGQRRGLGWLLWALGIRQEVAGENSPGVTNAKGCIGDNSLCSSAPVPLLVLLPVLPWSRAQQHLVFPVVHQL